MTLTHEHVQESYPVAPEQQVSHEVLTELDQKMEAYMHDEDLRELILAVAEERNAAIANENVAAQEEGRPLARSIEIPDLEASDLSEEAFMDAALAAFDFRKGAGRNAIQGGQMSERAETALAKMIEKMKMRQDTEPTRRDFDMAFVLGGAAKTPMTRLNYLVELMEEDKVRTDTIILLGSDRPLDEKLVNGKNERDRAETLGYDKDGIPAKTEFDLLRNTAAEKFDIDPSEWMYVMGHDERVPVSGSMQHVWRVAYAELPEGKHVMVTSAAMLDENRYHPNGKARSISNTKDGYLMSAEMMRDHAEEGKELNALSVTNAIFVPFQGADAAGALAVPYGVKSETVGFTREHSGLPEWPGGSKLYVQEILSALRKTQANRDYVREYAEPAK